MEVCDRQLRPLISSIAFEGWTSRRNNFLPSEEKQSESENIPYKIEALCAMQQKISSKTIFAMSGGTVFKIPVYPWK